jgi:hypothetical protein
MPVLVAMRRKRGCDRRAAMAAHSVSVAARPMSARRFDSIRPPVHGAPERAASGLLLWLESIASRELCHTAVTAKTDDLFEIEEQAERLDTERLFT